MKRLVIIVSIGISTLLFGQARSTVTFKLNTSTAPGFTDSSHTLVIRGSMNGWAGNDWAMTNVGGDYWAYTTTTAMAMGNYEYKYVMLDVLENVNWESTDNRALTLAGATAYVILDQDYWESGTTPPYTPTDSVDVWFSEKDENSIFIE